MAEIKEQTRMQFEAGLMSVKLYGKLYKQSKHSDWKSLLLVCFLNILVLILGVVLFKIFSIK